MKNMDRNDVTVEYLKALYNTGKFDPDRWTWCISKEMRLQEGGGYKAEWGVWILGRGCGQYFGIIWCADEVEARAICRDFGEETPLMGVC